MKTTSRIVVSFLVLASPALAQEPVPAARASIWSASAGYAYLNLGMPSSPPMNLNGFDTSVTSDFLPRLGATADFCYAGSSVAPVVGHHASVLSYLVGPVFYPIRNRSLEFYVRGLFGGIRVAGPIFFSDGRTGAGWVNQFSWAVGSGIEYRISGHMHFQVGADYLRTNFLNSSLTIRGQNSMRMVFGAVYDFDPFGKRR